MAEIDSNWLSENINNSRRKHKTKWAWRICPYDNMICIKFNLDFLVLYQMYFKNYFANRFKNWRVSQAIYNIFFRVLSDLQLSP